MERPRLLSRHLRVEEEMSDGRALPLTDQAWEKGSDCSNRRKHRCGVRGSWLKCSRGPVSGGTVLAFIVATRMTSPKQRD